MNGHPEASSRLAFDAYEIDLETGELWKAGRRVKLQSQPFKVLGGLLAHPGQVISRDTLRQLVWGDQTVGDLDHSLGIAVNKIRDALGDSADAPRYIETLSRRGYRFLAPVVSLPSSSAQEIPPRKKLSTDEEPSSGSTSPGPLLPPSSAGPAHQLAPPLSLDLPVVAVRPAPALRLALAGVGLVILLLGILVLWLWQASSTTPTLHRVEQITHSDRIFPGAPSMESLPVLASDGTRIFTSVLENGHLQVSAIDIHTGALRPLPLPSELSESAVSDLSPDGTRLLLRSHRTPESEQPLWVVPTAGGTALRVGDLLAHDAVWMPDGNSILFAAGNDLSLYRLKDGNSTRFAALPGRGFSMRWSPSRRQLRLTILDPIAHTSSLWELSATGGSAHPLLKGWSTPASECCGVWTADGSRYIFQSSHDGASDLWQLQGSTPLKLTDGPLSYAAPVASREAHRLFFLGMDSHAEVERFDRARNRFLPDHSVLADATRVTYSRDTLWVAWTDPAGHLFRARAADGSEKLQLTPDYLQVFLARWSPDRQTLALMAREPGKAWHLYRISANGGTPQLLLDEPRNAADPTWSPDGRALAFGRTSDLMGRESGSHRIQILDLATRRLSDLPDSDGLFSPRWSPDGRWILALTLRDQKPLLFDTSTRAWQPLGSLTIADPVWSADSRSLFAHTSFSDPQTIVRIPVPSGASSVIATLNSRNTTEEADFVFIGITPDDLPLIRVRSETGNLYTLSLDRK